MREQSNSDYFRSRDVFGGSGLTLEHFDSLPPGKRRAKFLTMAILRANVWSERNSMTADEERPIRYVLYLSHARHDQPDPYRQQRERMKRFASASGLDVVRIVEEPEPNSRSPRAGLVEVWRMIEADEANGILCEGTFRITRSVPDILQLHAALKSQRTNLQSLRTLHDEFRKNEEPQPGMKKQRKRKGSLIW